MKRVLGCLTVVAALGGAYVLVPTQAEADPLDLVTLCHATGMPDGRGVVITVSRNVEDGHRQHGDCGPVRTIPDPDGMHCVCNDW
jgi:hypothetical protein